jgi:hypothetical protein
VILFGDEVQRLVTGADRRLLLLLAAGVLGLLGLLM